MGSFDNNCARSNLTVGNDGNDSGKIIQLLRKFQSFVYTADIIFKILFKLH